MTRVGFAVLALVGLCTCRDAPEQRLSLEYYARRVRRSSPSDPFPRLWQVPPFAFRDAHGAPVTREALFGHVWIANFIYTQCPTACPLLSSRMMRLQRRLTDPGMRFVSFSVDPKRDSPQALARYATSWNAQERRWVLVSTTTSELPRFAQAMRVTQAEVPEADGEIIHSTSFVLVDREGWVRGAYESADQEDLDEIIHDAAELAGTPAAPGISDRGEALFVGLGCQGCHGNPKVAPPLSGLMGRPVMQPDGGAAAADRDYVRRAIIAPNALAVPGYLAIMPSYQDALALPQLEDLVDFVERLPPAPAGEAAGSPQARWVVDPTCGMSVRDEPGAPRLRHQGRDYVFCSELCKERFEKKSAPQ